jgi:hypothetical protein
VRCGGYGVGILSEATLVDLPGHPLSQLVHHGARVL